MARRRFDRATRGGGSVLVQFGPRSFEPATERYARPPVPPAYVPIADNIPLESAYVDTATPDEHWPDWDAINHFISALDLRRRGADEVHTRNVDRLIEKHAKDLYFVRKTALASGNASFVLTVKALFEIFSTGFVVGWMYKSPNYHKVLRVVAKDGVNGAYPEWIKIAEDRAKEYER